VLLYVKKAFHLKEMFDLEEKAELVWNKDAHSLYKNNFG
jgi:hypothetical protein